MHFTESHRTGRRSGLTRLCLTALAGLLTAGMLLTAVGAHYDTAYWNETSRAGSNYGWMGLLDGELTLSKLSLPGTHDSMAYKSDLAGLDSLRTQSMDLWTQLASGIRVLDIGLYYDTTSFKIYRGSTSLGYNLDDVLSTVQKFLQQYPTETVIVNLKQNGSSASNEQMKTLFDTYYHKYKDLFYGYNGNIGAGGTYDSENPKLDAIRGKCVILTDITTLMSYGIRYPMQNVQNDAYLSDNWALYSKWEKVKAQLVAADEANEKDANRMNFYMNYLNGSGGAFPYFVASGHSSPETGAPALITGLTEPGWHSWYPDFPRGAWFGVIATIYFEGTNTLTADYLTNNDVSYCGLIMADFPGERLINAVINCNSFPVRIYEHSNYEGASRILGLGWTNYGAWGENWNDNISSVKVADGYKATFYEHGGFTGKSVSFTSDMSWVGDEYNDTFSAVVIERVK